MIDIERAFARDGNNIRLPTTEVFLCTASVELAKSKKIRYWTDRNAVLLPTFLTDIVLTVGETTAEALVKIFSKRINNQEVDNDNEALDADK